VEFVENCMYFQYLLCKIPCEIPMEFSSPTPEPGDADHARADQPAGAVHPGDVGLLEKGAASGME
jgi:hypothetical protein